MVRVTISIAIGIPDRQRAGAADVEHVFDAFAERRDLRAVHVDAEFDEDDAEAREQSGAVRCDHAQHRPLQLRVVRQVRLRRPLKLLQTTRNAAFREFGVTFEIAQLRDQRTFDVPASRRVRADRMAGLVEHDVAVEAQISGRRMDPRVVNRQAQLIDRDDARRKQPRLVARVQEYLRGAFFADMTDHVAHEHERAGSEVVFRDRFGQRDDLRDGVLHEELGIGIVPQRQRAFAVDAAFLAASPTLPSGGARCTQRDRPAG